VNRLKWNDSDFAKITLESNWKTHDSWIESIRCLPKDSQP